VSTTPCRVHRLWALGAQHTTASTIPPPHSLFALVARLSATHKRAQTVSGPRLGLSIELCETKFVDHPCEIDLFQNTFAALFCRATPWTSVMRELPLALPLRPWGIAHSFDAETPPAAQCTSQAPRRL